jgi:hypothetical protein
MHSAVHRLRVASLTFLAWIALIGVALETYSRFLFPDNPFGVNTLSEIVFDQEIGWIGRANLRTNSSHGDYPIPVPVSINADGFRDDDWDEKLRRARDTQSKKILMLGDSWLYGWGSEKSERLSESLAHRYRLAGLPVEIFNAGIPAFGASQERRLLPRLLARVKPDVVALLFCPNDYGDTALPYDHRYPSTRVYKPFYDPQGELILNERVPQRPSLRIQDSWLGFLRLRYAADVFYYAWQDRLYARQGVPVAADFPVPVHRLDDLLFQDPTHPVFQTVERTVMHLYRDMHAIVREGRARFFVIAGHPSSDPVIALKIQDLGIDLVSFPGESRSVLPWTAIYQDGHPNFLWSWMLSGSVFSYVEKKEPQPGFADMPSLAGIPSKLILNTDDPSAKYLTGTWGRPEEKSRWALEGGQSRTGATPRFMVRAPDPTSGKALVKIAAWAPHDQPLSVFDQHGRELCRWTITPGRYDYECEVMPDRTGLLLGKLTSPHRAVRTAGAPQEQDPQRLAAITSISME